MGRRGHRWAGGLGGGVGARGAADELARKLERLGRWRTMSRRTCTPRCWEWGRGTRLGEGDGGRMTYFGAKEY